MTTPSLFKPLQNKNTCKALVLLLAFASIVTANPIALAQINLSGSGQNSAKGPTTATGETSRSFSPGANPRSLMEKVLAVVVANDVNGLGNLVDWPPQLSAKEREAAKKNLLDVLNRFGEFNPSQISSDPLGDPENGENPTTENVGTINTGKFQVPIVLQNTAANPTSNPESSVWKISRKTIEALAVIERQPPSWFEGLVTRLPYGNALMSEHAGLALWQWLGTLLFLIACILLGKMIAWSVDTVLAKSSRLGKWRTDGTARGLTIPVAVVIAITVFRIALPSLGIPIEYRETLLMTTRLVQILFVTLLLLRLINIGFTIYNYILVKSDRSAATALLPPLRKALKTIICLGAIIAGMRTLGFDVSAIVAGLGVGGLAVALASQKTVENLFGGISVVLDQPVRVGEAGRYGSITGVVEDIGLRSTRIRTLDRTIVTIPNAEFCQIQIENYASRDRIRYYMILGVRYDTSAAQLKMLLQKLRQMFADHQFVFHEGRRVRFLNLGSSALEIEIVAYVTTTDYDRYLEIREELNFLVMDIVAECGTECAYPTQSIYTGAIEPLSPQARQAAEVYLAKHTGNPSK